MIEAMMPLMITSPHGGRIVNVSSRLGRVNGRRNVSSLYSFLLVHLDLLDMFELHIPQFFCFNVFVSLHCQRIGDPSLRERLLNDDHLSEELINEMVMKFLEQTKQDNWSSSNEWPQMYTDYSISKLAVNAYTRLLARRLLDRPEGQKIYINCFCPGWVKTAMTGWEGNISAEEGADTGVWLALVPQEQATIGKFFAERREISF